MENVFNQEIVKGLYPECCMLPEAMRVWQLPKGKENKLQEMCESGNYFGQIKKDGYWYQFIKGETTSYLFSRNVSVATGLLTEKLDNVPHLREALSVLPKDTIVIGEVYVPGGTSKDTTRIMGCLAAEAIRRQEKEGYVHFYMHDIIAFDGVSIMHMPAEKRYEVLKKLYDSFNLASYDYLELAEIHYDNLFEKIGTALDNGEEGMVLKKKDYPYVPGKKPAWSAIKCKKVDYADVVAMGFEDATRDYEGTEIENWEYWESADGIKIKGKYYGTYGCDPITKPYFHGWKTSIRIGGYTKDGELKEIGTVSSGLTDELREDLAKNPDKYLGKTLMVQCMEKDKKEHTLRHPIFKGFREDKNPNECTLEEIF